MDDRQFEECIKAMVQGDKQGLRQIYEAYVGYVYTITYGILGNKENAEDVTSEFFIKLWEKADYYKGGEGHKGHKGYLASMARNMSIDYLRKYKREELTAAVHDMENEESGRQKYAGRREKKLREDKAVSVEQKVIEEMTIEEALMKLKQGERQIVDMKVLGGLTFKEIAETLMLPMGTVTWKYQNAMKKLRRCGYEES